MRFVVPALLFVSSFAALPASAEEGMITLKPEQIGQIFCLSRLGNDEGAVSGLLSPDLTTVIADAWAKSVAWETANPGEKPPLGDGIPWQAAPDYAAECSVGLATLMATDAKVEIEYGSPSSPTPVTPTPCCSSERP